MRQNEFNVGADVNIEGVLKTLGLKGSFSANYKRWTTSSTELSQHIELRMEEKLKKVVDVPTGKYFLVAAEMKLFQFAISGTNEKRRVVLATGNLLTGSFGREDLKNFILDTTFDSVAKQFGLSVHSLENIQSYLTQAPCINREFPIAGRFYMIMNSQYPGSRIPTITRAWFPKYLTPIPPYMKAYKQK